MTHSFYFLSFDGIAIGRARCRNCGLKVPVRAARQLEGLPCR
jgi:hypothetical protein